MLDANNARALHQTALVIHESLKVIPSSTHDHFIATVISRFNDPDLAKSRLIACLAYICQGLEANIRRSNDPNQRKN